MIEIKITNDGGPGELRRLASALLILAGDEASKLPAAIAAAVPFAVPGGPVRGSGMPVAIDAPYGEGWKIAPNDDPSKGADAEGDPDPATVFGEADPDPATVFGAGNVAAGSGSASSLSPASTVAGSPETNGTYAAGPTGDAGNGQGATSLTPSGTPAAPSSTVQTGGVVTDSNGLPWDVRIHASTKTTNKDKSWKKKPNVDPNLVAQVEAELRAIMAIPATGNAIPAPPAAGAPATPPANVVPPPPPASAPAGNAPAIPMPPGSPTTTPGAAGSSITTFPQLLTAVTTAVANGTLSETYVQQVLASVGVAVLPQLAPNPTLVATVAAALFPVQ